MGNKARQGREDEDDIPGPRYRGWVFFKGATGADPVRKDKGRLPDHARAGLDARMGRFRDGTTRRHDHTHLGGGLHELRYREGNNHYRLLFAVWGDRLVALDVYYKNQNKTDTDRAARRWKDWQKRYGLHPPAGG